MIIPQRLSSTEYAVTCPNCSESYSVTTGRVDPRDPAAPAGLKTTPLPSGCTTQTKRNGKLLYTFTCPNCKKDQSLVL